MMEFIVLHPRSSTSTTSTTLIEIKKTELMPSDAEISAMETFLEVLKPIVEITETLGGERVVTISAVRPLLHKLLSIHLVERSSDSPLAKTIKKILMADLKDRHSEETVTSLINKACLLDPRFKALAFMIESDKSHVTALVKEEAQKFNHNDSTGSTRSDTSTVNLTEDDDAAPPAKKAKNGLMSLLDDVINSKADDDRCLILKERKLKLKEK